MEAELRHKEYRFSGIGGLNIFYQSWHPSEYARLVAIIPGLGDHSGRYGYLMEALSEKGVAFYGMDMRGHGRSEGKRGFLSHYDHYLRDVLSFLEGIREAEPEKKIYLLGHSMGALTAIEFVLDYPKEASMLAGALISGPPLELGVKVPWIKKTAADLLSSLFPWITLGNELDPAELSRDPEEVRKYVEDPLVHDRISLRLFTEMLRVQADIMERASEYRLPSLFLHGGGDRIALATGTRAFFDKIPIEDKAIAVHEGYYHEWFNDLGRETYFAELEAWLEAH
jgi:alpha-beta hydrolase superfamily lysophospholipase